MFGNNELPIAVIPFIEMIKFDICKYLTPKEDKVDIHATKPITDRNAVFKFLNDMYSKDTEFMTMIDKRCNQHVDTDLLINTAIDEYIDEHNGKNIDKGMYSKCMKYIRDTLFS